MADNTPQVGTDCWFIVRAIKVGGIKPVIKENITIMVGINPHPNREPREFTS